MPYLTMFRLLLCVLACSMVRADTAPLLPATLPAAPSGPHADPKFHVDMKQAVTYLASDDLQGRLVGTPGINRAASFIAANFSKLGLRTAPGLDGYFQPFSMVLRVNPDPQKTTFSAAGQSFRLANDFMPLRGSIEGSASGPLAFVGYAISDSDRHYDDFDGIDVKGKVVLAMRFEPHEKSGKSRFSNNDEWTKDATIPQKVEAAVKRGAVAVVLVNPALYHDGESLVPFSHNYPKETVPVIQITQESADGLLAAAKAPTLKALQAGIDESLKPHSFVMDSISANVSVGFQRSEANVVNVVALLPGTGPTADEYVVVGAHYDHLGMGGRFSTTPWVHDIHHGADDNASGTVAMLDLADRFVHLGPQPRSILFIAFTGEEEGLIGSQYFVEHPPVPLGKIASMLNLDMVGRISNEKLLIGGKGTAPAFDQLIAKADEGLPLKLGEFGRGGLGPSDHMSFALQHVPVLFFFSGMHLDYHRPTDTADKINYEGMAQAVDLGERVVKALASLPRQQYVDKYDAQMPSPMGIGPGHGASMGAIPDYSQGEDATGGMRIGGIMPGSPAAKAGLKAGDVVVQFGDAKIQNMMDYTEALGRHKPGEVVKLKILRNNQSVDIEATLTKRKE